MRFSGWPPGAVAFYESLETHNTKAWWTEHKAEYEEYVLAPFLALNDEVEAEFGPLRVFRPYRDVRFAKDKTPYKTAQGAVTEGEGGSAFYVALDSGGLFVGAGYHHMASDQLERYRAAVADDRSGPVLERVVGETRAARLDVGGDALKTAPR